MKVEVEEIEPCKRRLVVEAPEAEVAAAWEAAFGRVQRQARLPGFRKGKVPRSLVRAHFAEEVRRAVAEQLVPDAYRRALDEVHLDPVEEPEVRDLHLEEGRPLRFVAEVEIKPTIVLGEYRGLKVVHTSGQVGDADVEAALHHLAERQATLTTTAHPARLGDHVIVDYTLEPEGAEPRSEQGYAFEVGGGRVLPEMDEAVLGLEAGAERSVTVRFPDQHSREELRGRTGQLALRIVEVKEKELPALDDDFARALGGHQTLAEVRETLRGSLEAERERQDRRALEEKLVDALLSSHDFTVPDSLVLREIAHRIGHARERLKSQGVDPDTLPWDYNQLTAELRPDAERSVRRALLLDAVAEKEDVAVDEGAVDTEIAGLAAESGRAPQAIRALLQRSGDLDGLRHRLRERKVLSFLVEHADIQPEA